MNKKLNKLGKLNKSLKSPRELGGVFLPKGSRKRFDFMFVAEMPSMNEPKKKGDNKESFNFGVTARDRFFQEMMTKYGVAGSYVTDIVKERDIPRRPTRAKILKWLPFLIQEIEIMRPKYLVVIGKINYERNFIKFVEPEIENKKIVIDWVFHYSPQVSRNKFEQRFKEVIRKIR